MKKFTYLSLLAFTLFILSACTTDNNGSRAILGNPDAPILVEEFSDFECPACASLAPQLEELVLRNPDIVRLEFHHFPLSYHENAFKAAEAAECAGEFGKFWEFVKKAFDNQKNLSVDNLKSFAGELGLEQTAFNDCLDSGIKKSRVKNDIYEGRRRQLSYTPSIYVNGQLIQWNGAEQFEAYLRSLPTD